MAKFRYKSFPARRIGLKRIYESADLGAFPREVLDCPKVRQVYGRLQFPQFPENRVYTCGSFVASIDGRIAFPASPDGTLVAKKNLFDPDGGLCDFWILNMLRAVSDAVLMGSLALKREPKLTGRIFDEELEAARLSAGKPAIPLHIVVTRSGRNLPVSARIISSPDLPAIIATSPRGVEAIEQKLTVPYRNLGSYARPDEIEPGNVDMFQDPLGIIGLGKGNDMDLPVFVAVLKKLGINMMLVESPEFLVSLMREALLDELFLNTSSVFIGGRGLTLGESAPAFSAAEHPHGQVLSVHSHSDHFFYVRYRMRY
jgi:riboflavin biosynthesis pyrimidine reductase